MRHSLLVGGSSFKPEHVGVVDVTFQGVPRTGGVTVETVDRQGLVCRCESALSRGMINYTEMRPQCITQDQVIIFKLAGLWPVLNIFRRRLCWTLKTS
jgi:hypothetical protein